MPENNLSNGKAANPARKSGDEQLYRSSPDFEQSKRSAAATTVELTLTEEQFRHLAFAVLCQVGELQDGPEAGDPEVLEAIQRLDEVLGLCSALERGRLS